MTLRLTPDVLAGAYELNRATHPISAWRLPLSKYVEFRVTRSRKHIGYCQKASFAPDAHFILEFSERTIGSYQTLLVFMAHELCHMRQMIEKTETKGVEHNQAFCRLAYQVAKAQGWDPKLLVWW